MIVAEYSRGEAYSSKLLYDKDAGWAVENSTTGAHPANLVDVMEWLAQFFDCAEVHSAEALAEAFWAVGLGLRQLAEFTGLTTY